MRVIGPKNKVRKFLAASLFKPEAVFYKGERKLAKLVYSNSGFNLLLSGSERLQKQAAGAVRFIKRNKNEFDWMKAYGIRTPTVDFGLYDIATESFPWPTYRLSRNFIVLAAEYGFEIELSFYGKS